MKNRPHQECYARSCQEIEDLKRRCYQGKHTEKQRRWEGFPTQHDQESRTVSLLRDQVRKISIEDSQIFCDPDSPSSCDSAHVSRRALVPSSSRKHSRESRVQRNTRENMSIPGSVFDCQLARRVPEELHNDSRNLATSSAILRSEGIERGGCEEPLQSILLPCLSVRARKSLDDRNCLVSVTNHAAGIGLVLEVAGQFRVISPRRCIWIFFPDQTEFQSWVVNFRAEICPKAKNLALALQWIKEIEAASSLKDLINPKSITGKDFSDCEELDLTMAAELERCSDKYPHFQKRIRVEEQRAQEDNRFPWGSQIVEPWQKALGKILTPNGRLENVFSGRQLGHVQEETLVVFYTRMPREMVRQRGKKWRTQEDLA